MTYPNKIEIISDNNILEFKEVKTLNKVLTLVYVYKVSKTKMGLTLSLPLSQLEGMLKNNICKII